MTQATELIERTYTVGRYRATFRAQLAIGQVAGLQVDWQPHLPQKLNKVALEQYYSARHRFVTELGERLGGTVVVVDA